VGCDIHPINNRRILQTLRKQFGANEDAINAWCGTWISAGFDAYEALLAADPKRGRFSFGDAPSLADVYLIPQVESALRFKVDMGRWPLIRAVDKACGELDAFQKAAPLAQPDAG
jgi:maleylpyruvate isomerase